MDTGKPDYTELTSVLPFPLAIIYATGIYRPAADISFA